MLLKPSVNIENITRLADFIESEQHKWAYGGSCCFYGQAARIGCDPETIDQFGELATFLGVSRSTAWNLYSRHADHSVWPTDGSLTRSEAVSILRELAATGRLPTEVET